MRIEIICTGDEVLTGAIVNTNFSYISQKLGDVGLAVLWGITVGDDRQTLLEAFLFDFSGDLYGETIEVLFIGWIRAEAKFASAAALIAQMKLDDARAREILQAPSAS